MLETLRGVTSTAKSLIKGEHVYAVLEGNRDCNRGCSYCAVPQQYSREQEQTLGETFQTIDWLYNQGYRGLSYLGGEPLAPFRTKEGITFEDHTVEVVKHAKKKGMLINVTTNGDYIRQDTIDRLRKAGLDMLSLSLHTYSEQGLNHLVRGARLAAATGIVPVVQTVFTSERSSQIPGIAAHVAGNGIIFSLGIVQEKGGGFSTAQGEQSLVPNVDQQKDVLGALLRLKTFGMIRNNRNFLDHAPDYPDNSWTCDPERDSFIHIGAGGKVNICSDVRTNISVVELQDLSDSSWRDLKRARVETCGNCMFHCYYESQNPNVAGDIPTFLVMGLIKSGNARAAEKWGRLAVRAAKASHKKVDWGLNFDKQQS